MMLTAVVKENRLEVGNWYLTVTPLSSHNLKVKAMHKTDGRNWDFDSIEEALEAIDWVE